MDISSSFKKTFNSQGSYKLQQHGRKISISGAQLEDAQQEVQPILSDHNRQSYRPSSMLPPAAAAGGSSSPEFIVKIDEGNQYTARPTTVATIPINNPTAGPRKNNHCNDRRESSLDIWGDDANNAMHQQARLNVQLEDPPSKLIGQFLNRQKAAGGEMALDMDPEMDELHTNEHSNRSSNQYEGSVKQTNHNFPMPKELRVSFQAPNSNRSSSIAIDMHPDEPKICQHSDDSSDDYDDNANENEIRSLHNRRQYPNVMMSNVDLNNNNNGDEGQVLRCTSIQKRFSTLGRLKTKSRLIDPPEERKADNTKSGQLRSGMLNRASGMMGKPGDDDEDDPLFDEDLPDEYKEAKCSALFFAQWISLILIVTALVCTLTIPKLKRKSFRGLSLWKWEVLVLVLICGRLVSGWWIRIVVFFIERNFFMRKRILYFVYGVRNAVQNCIWLGLVLIAWDSMFDKEVDGDNTFLKYVNKVMVCLLVGTLLWLVKTLMVKVLASSFHVSTFFDRIQESVFNQYVIETLSGPPLIEIRNFQEDEDRTMAEVQRLQNAGATLPPGLASPFQAKAAGGGGGGGLPPRPPPAKGMSFKISGSINKTQDDQKGISIDHLHRLNNKNVSAWGMKRLINIVKHGALSTMDERALNSSQGDDEASTQIRSEQEAKVAARKIFRNVAKPRAKFIYVQDLMRFLREEEALKTLNIVEGSPESEKISKASLKNWVVNAFRERKALTLTLNDTKTAVKKLHHMVNVVVGIIILVISLVILEIATTKLLLFVSSQVVVLAFVFGNTCKTIFEDILFVFVMHPFDVGDRCEIDGVQMIVEEMNILTTVFLRADNQKIMYPNVTLATKPIGNYYRSPDMGDVIDFGVHIATPAEKIAVMKQRITCYIESRSDHWYPSPSVVLMNFDYLHELKMSVWIRHRMNHQDMGEKWKRRAQLVEEMVKIFKDLDIEYRLYPLDVNIRAMPPLDSTRIPSTWTPPPGI